MELTYHTLDVFTDTTFGGNPLGVFTDATHLPTELMQQVAREMNLSETVFLGPPEADGTARVRIFTPGVEVPFAGHPTVGSAIYLAARMEGTDDGSREIVLEEKVVPGLRTLPRFDAPDGETTDVRSGVKDALGALGVVEIAADAAWAPVPHVFTGRVRGLDGGAPGRVPVILCWNDRPTVHAWSAPDGAFSVKGLAFGAGTWTVRAGGGGHGSASWTSAEILPGAAASDHAVGGKRVSGGNVDVGECLFLNSAQRLPVTPRRFNQFAGRCVGLGQTAADHEVRPATH